jgi:hypothetical protein
MNTLASCFMRLLVIFVLAAVSQAAERVGPVAVDVEVEQVTEHLETWRTTFGYWVEREARNARVGVAQVMQKGQRPLQVTVEFFFFGQRIEGKPTLELYHYHKRHATIPPMLTVQVFTISPTIVLKKLQPKMADERRETSGVRPFGWFVNVRHGDTLVASVGNTPEAGRNLQKVLAKTPRATLDELHKRAEERISRKD